MRNSIFIILVGFLIGCCKDIQEDPSKKCSNRLYYDVNYRIGTWSRQANSGKFDPTKFRFTSDSFVDVYLNGIDSWALHQRYQFLQCNQFDLNNFWNPAKPPFQNWFTYTTSYNSINEEWYLILPEIQGTGYDTLINKKE